MLNNIKYVVLYHMESIHLNELEQERLLWIDQSPYQSHLEFLFSQQLNKIR